MHLPLAYDNWLEHWSQSGPDLMDAYADMQYSFIPGLLPELAMQIPAEEVLTVLERVIGRGTLNDALQPETTIPSPLAHHTDTQWMKRTNMVGINVRTLGNFFNIVKYALTLPRSQQSIHFLPIWEPGVVDSLYGIASWNINPEFFSEELYELYPYLDTVEKQLKVVTNLLHGMDRIVGMDVIPHTDRYSEIVIANPHYFEWLCRKGDQIVDHRADLHEEAQTVIFDWLVEADSALPQLDLPETAAIFFSRDYGDEKRKGALFGPPDDKHLRNERRVNLVYTLYDAGLEPVPATMAPPYRGLQVKRDSIPDPDPEGRIWYDYEITNPETMSRVFGPLTRYKLYERLHDNQKWEIDFERPRKEVWEYVCHNYAAVQEAFNFDFMRGDMSHVQMRPEGVPDTVDRFYDIQMAVAQYIQADAPYFGYFAETFLAPAGFMAYGDEADHLDQAMADATLGDLQSMIVGSNEFMQAFRWYLDLQATRYFAPSFTIMTGDKDDPRFDKFYLKGNAARLFLALFLTDMPSYMGLGFETRDPHPEPAPNEHYTKLYVFRIASGSKATTGPYVWGQNGPLFRKLTRLRLLAEQILSTIEEANTHWLRPPDPTNGHRLIAWTQVDRPQYLFIVNLDIHQPLTNQKIPVSIDDWRPRQLHWVFSTEEQEETVSQEISFTGKHLQIKQLYPGEGRIYKVDTIADNA